MDDDSSGSPADSDADPASVRATYDRIADHFSKTREYAWPEVEAFLDGRSGAVGLDIGCGNGRHTELLAERCGRAVGLDASRGMLAQARERARERETDFELGQADAAALPVATGSVDLATYVATLPHLRTRERRLASLDDLARVLVADGRALVSAWSTAHDRFESEAPRASDSRAADSRETAAGFDTTVDWTLPGGETVDRFYHIYDPEEFRADVAASALELVEFEISSGNCYGVVRSEGKRS